MKTKSTVQLPNFLPKANIDNSLTVIFEKIPVVNDILISSSHTTALIYAAERLGITSSACLAEAIDDWLSIVAPARIEEVSQNEKSANVIAFPQQEDGLNDDEIPCDRQYRI